MRRQDQVYDELLVLRCQEGDAAAFGQLVDRWQQRLWTHAHRLTSDEDAAWDVLQDCWMAIIEGISGLRDVAAFPAWAYRIVSHRCGDLIGKRQRERNLVETYAEHKRRAEDELADSRERCDSVKQAIRHLSGSDRMLLSLYYQDEFAVAEIAEILDIPPGTVKSRLHYARKRLRDMMEECPDG